MTRTSKANKTTNIARMTRFPIECTPEMSSTYARASSLDERSWVKTPAIINRIRPQSRGSPSARGEPVQKEQRARRRQGAARGQEEHEG